MSTGKSGTYTFDMVHERLTELLRGFDILDDEYMIVFESTLIYDNDNLQKALLKLKESSNPKINAVATELLSKWQQPKNRPLPVPPGSTPPPTRQPPTPPISTKPLPVRLTKDPLIPPPPTRKPPLSRAERAKQATDISSPRDSSPRDPLIPPPPSRKPPLSRAERAKQAIEPKEEEDILDILEPLFNQPTKTDKDRPVKKTALGNSKVVIGNLLAEPEKNIIVDPANEKTMNGNGGVSGAIKAWYKTKHLDKSYEKDLLKFPVVAGKRCPNGEVKHTFTGGIDIIHSSAPDLREKVNRETDSTLPSDAAKQKLFEAYYNAFRMAHNLNSHDHQQKPLNCPLLGAGTFKWPAEISAEIAGKAVTAFRDKYGNDLQINLFMRQEDLKNGLTEQKLQTAIEKGSKGVRFSDNAASSKEQANALQKPTAIPVPTTMAPQKPFPATPSSTSATTSTQETSKPPVDPHKNAILSFLTTVVKNMSSDYADKESKQHFIDETNQYRVHQDKEISDKANAVWNQVLGLAEGLVIPKLPVVKSVKGSNLGNMDVDVEKMYKKEREVSLGQSKTLNTFARNAVKRIGHIKNAYRDKQIAGLQELVDKVNQANSPQDKQSTTQDLLSALQYIKYEIKSSKKPVSLTSALDKVCDEIIAKIPDHTKSSQPNHDQGKNALESTNAYQTTAVKAKGKPKN